MNNQIEIDNFLKDYWGAFLLSVKEKYGKETLKKMLTELTPENKKIVDKAILEIVFGIK